MLWSSMPRRIDVALAGNIDLRVDAHSPNHYIFVLLRFQIAGPDHKDTARLASFIVKRTDHEIQNAMRECHWAAA